MPEIRRMLRMVAQPNMHVKAGFWRAGGAWGGMGGDDGKEWEESKVFEDFFVLWRILAVGGGCG